MKRTGSIRLAGPVWSGRANGGPPLSALHVPRGGIVRALIDIFEDASAGQDPRIGAFMQQVLRAGAGEREQSLHLPPPFRANLTRQRVAVVIESTSPREWSVMLDAARREYPHAELWLWPAAAMRHMPKCRDMTDDPLEFRLAPCGSNLLFALPYLACVYTVEAFEGLHALIAGVPTRVFGKPFYAGWGLTGDEQLISERPCRPSVEALFDAIYLRLARYVDPFTKRSGSLEAVLDAIELQRSVQRSHADLGKLAAWRVQFWKRRYVAPFAKAGGGHIRWIDNAASIRRDESALLWGARNANDLPAGTSIVRIEDGFLHSWGLGSDFIAPRSQVIDREGIYFDARRPSALTRILNETPFDDAELARAAALRRSITQARLTKYNLGRRACAWQAPQGRRALLVIGQVGDDASVRHGSGRFATVDALLREVRLRNPDAFLVYKPHPDVLSGNRKGLVDASEFANVVDCRSDLISLLEAVEEVHTLSSLAGFDALLRGKKVFTYGLPFYAGWGLTEDALAPLVERKRVLTLDMLVAGALIRYPLYWDWQTRLFTTPESVVADLAARADRPFDPEAHPLSRFVKKSFRWSRNVLAYAHDQLKHTRLARGQSKGHLKEIK